MSPLLEERLRSQNLREFAIEARLFWGDRVLATFCFTHPGVITMGSGDDNHIVLPAGLTGLVKFPICEIGEDAKIFLTPHVEGELWAGDHVLNFDHMLAQHTLVYSESRCYFRLKPQDRVRYLLADGVHVVLGIVPKPDRPLDPGIDWRATIATFLACMITTWFAHINSTPPAQLEIQRKKELKRVAVMKFMPPQPPPPIIPPSPPPKKIQAAKKSETPRVAKVRSQPAPKPTRVVRESKRRETPARATVKIKRVAPKPAVHLPTKLAPKPARQQTKKIAVRRTAPTARPPVSQPSSHQSKFGLLDTFSKGSIQQKIAQTQRTGGQALEIAEDASGSSGTGSATMHGGLKGTGRGEEPATIGVALNTRGGRGGGAGYGRVPGLGNKSRASVSMSEDFEEITGTVDKDAIRRVVLGEKRTIKFCYEQELQRKSDLHGRLVIQWEIGSGGRVLRAKVRDSSLASSNVANCIINQLRTWRFPAPPDGVVAVIAFPFIFTSR